MKYIISHIIYMDLWIKIVDRTFLYYIKHFGHYYKTFMRSLNVIECNLLSVLKLIIDAHNKLLMITYNIYRIVYPAYSQHISSFHLTVQFSRMKASCVGIFKPLKIDL